MNTFITKHSVYYLVPNVPNMNACLLSMRNVSGSKHCKHTQLGREYNGNISTTASGKTCQAWAEQTPHQHPYTSDHDFPTDSSISAAENFCRNPGHDGYRKQYGQRDGYNTGHAGGPWCYTTDMCTEWEYCLIPSCPRGK